ncbi:CAP domain-containing protein [Ruminococcus sp. OA3]|uniref:CAP domain-containing protein n=1 Tax=Ruminococcus sp. OA3 TaxID=2914164 RepID=UPI001F051F67|nr:CAP domain-containing protein [Ruminococcus sp. OA3]MCH1983369.1 CAP domain-containing protein [Ruminococcus sp. OA3]
MKKHSLFAAVMAAGAVGSMTIPVHAADLGNVEEQLKTNGYAVIVEQAGSQEELNKILSELKGKFCDIHLNWQDCPDIAPPENNVPDADAPGETPDTDKPDTDAPDTDAPDTDAPDTDAPDTDVPGTDVPGADGNTPGTDTDKPETGERTFAEQVVDLVNAERAKAGLNALTIDQSIASAALVRAKETETSFSHTRPDGRAFSSVLTDNGISFRGAGENIAWGQRTPEEVMNGWMNSDGHRANILNAEFTKIGVGYYQNSAGTNYWTQLFTY